MERRVDWRKRSKDPYTSGEIDMLKYDKPERARILARTIASDLVLYNRQRIEEGIRDDAVFEVLADEIEEGRALYESRVTTEIYQNYNLYEKALVDKLLKSLAYIKADIW